MNFRNTSLFVVLTFCVLLVSVTIAQAVKENDKVIRVGFPIQHGISYIDDSGNYAGYMVDYLKQLSLYTNWEYEFVQVDGDTNTQISTLLEMLMNGDIYMLGTMNRNETLEELFLYPNHSYGTTYTALTVREDSTEWMEEDFEHWDGIEIAVYPGQNNRMEQFDQYAKLNGFTYEIVEYDKLTDVFEAVLNGEADATLQSDIAVVDGFRTVARFSPSPYYFALYRGNTDLLQTLNIALYNMDRAYPHLQTELYNEYFHSYGEFRISQSDREYISELGTIKVIFCDGDAPFQYVKDGEVKGLAVSFFNQFAEQIGLQYEPVVVQSCQEEIELIEQGQADMVACAATSSAYVAVDGIQFSLPYFRSNTISVSAQAASDISDNDTWQFYTNTQYILDKMRKGTEDNARLDFYSLTYYLQKKILYDELNIDWSSGKNVSYSVCITDNISDKMLTILNQYTNSLTSTQIQSMLYQYMSNDIEYTLSELLYINKELIFGLCILLVLMVYIYFLYRNNRQAKHEATVTKRRLQHLSHYDELTGAYNGTYFRTILSEKCRQQVPLALIALNLRNFKYINEAYSISTADKVLCYIKECLDSTSKQEEFFCRESADIFYLALSEDSPERVICRIQEVHTLIQEKCNTLLGQYPISICCGVVFIAKSPEPYSVTANLGYMMAALAQTKKKKQQDICIYDDKLHKSEQIRLYVENHMQTALEQEEFKLYLQPKINLADGTLNGAEALVRWQPKDRDMIYPDEFVPLFEENGFCVQLDLYMVEQVCKQIRAWLDSGLPPIRISVNQTRLLFASDGYVEKLLAITNRYQVSPKYITLEILESLALDGIERINDCIEKLRAVGFRISMDDFGSGYSSLNTLGKLKIDELKLDRLFLMDVTKDTKGIQRKVMACILALAKQLNITTVAEGVETKEDEKMITQLNCDYGQGYYYSRPISVARFEKDFLLPFCHNV